MTDPQSTASRILSPKSCALVVIDPQTKLMPAIFEADRVIKNTVLLIRLSQILSIPAVITTQYSQGLGPLVAEVACAAPGATPFDKTSFGCFGDENFVAHLKKVAPGRDTLLIAGVESHVCVTQTALGALNAGYEVHVARDATSSRTRENMGCRPPPHGPRRGRPQLHGNDDLRTAGQERHPGVQGHPSSAEVIASVPLCRQSPRQRQHCRGYHFRGRFLAEFTPSGKADSSLRSE